MTKIIGIPRMIGMTGDWDAKKTRMSRMTGLTGITYSQSWTKVLGTIMQYSYFLSEFPQKTVHPL